MCHGRRWFLDLALHKPDSPTTLANTVNTFTATQDHTLDPSATYSLKLTPTGGIDYDVTTGNSEDNGGAAGWSKADGSRVLDGGTWVTSGVGTSVHIAVEGRFINNPSTGMPDITGTARVSETFGAQR